MGTNCEQCKSGLTTFTSLGVDQSLSVKAAYQMLVQVWHPDRFDQSQSLKSQAESNTKLLNAAYDHLRSHLNIGVSVSEHVSAFSRNQPFAKEPEAAAHAANGSASSVEDAMSELIIAFEIDKEQALAALERFMISGDYTTEDFVYNAVITKSSMLYLPAYIFDCQFDAQWTASFGFDRFENYTHWQKRYDSDLKRHVKEPVTRTKTVTDWVVHSGNAPGYCTLEGYAGPSTLTYARRLVEESSQDSSFLDFSSSHLRGVEPLRFESSSEEIYQASVKQRVEKVISNEVRSYAQGDRQRDWRWTASISKRSKSLYFPAYSAQLSYAGQTYDVLISGLKAGLHLGDSLPVDQDRERSAARGFIPAKLTSITAFGAVGAVFYKYFTDSVADKAIFTWFNGLYFIWLVTVVLCLVAFGSKRRKAIMRDSREKRERALTARRLKQSFVNDGPISQVFPKQRFWSRSDLDGFLFSTLSVAASAAVVLPLFLWAPVGTSTASIVPASVPTETRNIPFPPSQNASNTESTSSAVQPEVTNTESASSAAQSESSPSAAQPEEGLRDLDTNTSNNSAVAESAPVSQADGLTPVNESYQPILNTLATWSRAEESNDPERQAECYANQMDRYFLKRNVSNDYIRDYMTSWLKEHSRRVVSFVPKDIAVEGESTGPVRVRMIKDVITKDDQGSSERLTRSVLYLRKEAGQWKIFSEQDFE